MPRTVRHRRRRFRNERMYRRRRALVLGSAAVVVVLVVAVVFGAVGGRFSGSGFSGRDVVSSSEASATAAVSDADVSRTRMPSPETVKNITSSLSGSLASIFSGASYAVSVVDMPSGKTVVGINTTKQFTSASTYKLYVAYSMISAVEKGTKTWDSTLNGMTLKECFATMIVNSDNDCPVAWLEENGFSTVNSQVHTAGFTHTNIEDMNMLTTAADLTDYLTRLYKGTFMDADSRAMLIGYMKTQVYRSGIPTGIGSNGTVADKVGFLDGLLHDASIIYTTKGDYVMVILTDGSSWASIAKAASTIYAAL